MSALSIFPLSLISTISAVSIQPNAHDQAAHSALSLRNQHNCKWPLPLRPQPLLLRHAKSEIGTSEPIQCGTDNAIPVCDNLRNRLLTVSSFTFEVAATTRQKSSSERILEELTGENRTPPPVLSSAPCSSSRPGTSPVHSSAEGRHDQQLK